MCLNIWSSVVALLGEAEACWSRQVTGGACVCTCVETKVNLGCGSSGVTQLAFHCFFLIEFLIRCINMYGGCACVYERVIVCV